MFIIKERKLPGVKYLMKYLGKNSASTVLQVMLDLTWYLGLFAVILLLASYLLGLIRGPELFLGTWQIETPGLVFRFTGGMPEPGHIQSVLMFILSLLMLAIGLLVLYQLRRIFSTLVRETPFTGENVRSIRIIGITVIAGSLLNTIVRFMIGIYISSIVHLPGFELFPNLKINFSGIFLGAVIIILAEVFRHGARLQEEQDLTV